MREKCSFPDGQSRSIAYWIGLKLPPFESKAEQAIVSTKRSISARKRILLFGLLRGKTRSCAVSPSTVTFMKILNAVGMPSTPGPQDAMASARLPRHPRYRFAGIEMAECRLAAR